MAFCPNCGVKAGSGKFCSSCGNKLPEEVQTDQGNTGLTAPMYSVSREKAWIGIFKELEPGEVISAQGITATPVIFVKEAEIKKVIGQERKEVPISISHSLFYLTSKRLVFLKLFEVAARELGEEKNQLSGVSGSFYELPLSGIMSVDMRPVRLNKNDTERFVNIFGGDENQLQRPALEVVYDEKVATGRAKDYVEAMLQRGALSRMWGKVLRVYDKIFILGEQSVSMMPQLQAIARSHTNN